MTPPFIPPVPDIGITPTVHLSVVVPVDVERQLDTAQALGELLALVERMHRADTGKLAATIMEYRRRAIAHDLPPLDDNVGDLALNQWHRFRNALEACALYFDRNGGIPDELRPAFTGTLLT